TARDVIAQAGVAPDETRIDVAADLRYAGQGHELTVAIDRSAILNRDAGAIEAAFAAEYQRRYNPLLEHLPVEGVSWRVRAQGPALAQQLDRKARAASTPPAVVERRPAFFHESGRHVEVAVYQRSHIRYDDVISGPALIEEETTTSVIGPG